MLETFTQTQSFSLEGGEIGMEATEHPLKVRYSQMTHKKMNTDALFMDSLANMYPYYTTHPIHWELKYRRRHYSHCQAPVLLT